MQKNSAAEFYLKICTWTFCCLILAAICHEVNNVLSRTSTRESEAFAARSILKIRNLQSQYATQNRGEFAPDFDTLIKSAGLDEHFSGQQPVVDSYVFTMIVSEAAPGKPPFYSINADPQVSEGVTATGTRHFYFDSTLGTMRQTEENRPANANDPAI